MSPTRLRCTVCGVEITLDEDTAVMLAEVEAFSAAHSSHGADLGVDTAVEVESDDESA
jgi:hypothetical protein